MLSVAHVHSSLDAVWSVQLSVGCCILSLFKLDHCCVVFIGIYVGRMTFPGCRINSCCADHMTARMCQFSNCVILDSLLNVCSIKSQCEQKSIVLFQRWHLALYSLCLVSLHFCVHTAKSHTADHMTACE